MRNRRIVHSLPTRPPRKGHVGQSRKVAVSRPGRSLTRSGGLAVTHLRGGASSRPWPPLSSRRLQGPGSRMVFFLFPVGRGFSFVFLQPRVICSYSLGWKAARFLKPTLLFSPSRDEPGRGLVSPFSPPPNLDHRVSSQFSPSIGGSSWVLTRTAQKPPHVGMTPLCASGTSL